MKYDDITIVEMGGEKKIPEMIDNLISNFGMNSKILAELFDVSPEVIKDFNQYKDTISIEKQVTIDGVLATMDFIPDITPDQRNKAIIDVLTEVHGISLETIAKFSKLTVQDIEKFMQDSDSIDFETKYKIASVSMFLHYIFKKNRK